MRISCLSSFLFLYIPSLKPKYTLCQDARKYPSLIYHPQAFQSGLIYKEKGVGEVELILFLVFLLLFLYAELCCSSSQSWVLPDHIDIPNQPTLQPTGELHYLVGREKKKKEGHLGFR